MSTTISSTLQERVASALADRKPLVSEDGRLQTLKDEKTTFEGLFLKQLHNIGVGNGGGGLSPHFFANLYILTAQVSFSNQILSIVCRWRCSCCRKLFALSASSP